MCVRVVPLARAFLTLVHTYTPDGLDLVHPCYAFKLQHGSLVQHQLPSTLSLSPRETFTLYAAMTAAPVLASVDEPTRQRLKALSPEGYFKAPFLTKNDVTAYANAIKAELNSWAAQGKSEW